MPYAYVGLGSNADAPRHRLQQAARALARLPAVRLRAVSPHYSSAPVGCPGRQRPYRNAVAELQTTLPPQRVFLRLRGLEKRIQKKRRVQNAPRRLDADYLFHGRARLRGKWLHLPHPRAHQRAFVLRPLADLLAAAPRRPLARAAILQALAACKNQPLHRIPCRSY